MNTTLTYAKSLGRFTYRTVEIMLWLIALWAICSLLLPAIRVNTDYKPPVNGIDIFIRSNGVHTDFVVPVKSGEIHWDSLFPRASFPGVDSTYRYVALGWGDQGFFLNTPTWDDLTFSTAVTAAFGLGESAMHVAYVRNRPVSGERCKPFTISHEQYQLLISYIRAGFRMEKNKVMLIAHPGYGTHDRFYEGNNRYSLFNTCNEWTGDGMQASGLPVGIWTPLEPAIMK